MGSILLSPPVAAIVVLVLCLAISRGLSRLSYRHDGDNGGKHKSYACGEQVESPRLQPNYAEFFPFAFFFTILHVVTLIVATAQTQTGGSIAIAVIYLAGACVGLSILFRKGSAADAAVTKDNDLGEN